MLLFGMPFLFTSTTACKRLGLTEYCKGNMQLYQFAGLVPQLKDSRVKLVFPKKTSILES
jgi:hypothetical protein